MPQHAHSTRAARQEPAWLRGSCVSGMPASSCGGGPGAALGDEGALKGFVTLGAAHKRPDVDDRTSLIKARSMLVILLATCKQTETALGAAANVLDTDLTRDLSLMIERTESELEAIMDKIKALPA